MCKEAANVSRFLPSAAFVEMVLAHSDTADERSAVDLQR
jgi:hypothetical protein